MPRKPEMLAACGEKISGFADDIVERRIVIGHERSLLETTHDDLRCTVDAPSGGLPLTIYAETFETVRLGWTNLSQKLTTAVGRSEAD